MRAYKQYTNNILYNMYICREGQLTHLFFPGRVGRGYGPHWTLVFVVSPAPSWLVGWVLKYYTKWFPMPPYGLILFGSEAT